MQAILVFCVKMVNLAPNLPQHGKEMVLWRRGGNRELAKCAPRAESTVTLALIAAQQHRRELFCSVVAPDNGAVIFPPQNQNPILLHGEKKYNPDTYCFFLVLSYISS